MTPWQKLLALRSLDALRPQDVVEWAYEELLAGRDTPSLRIVAGLRTPLDEWEVDYYLEATIDELGWRWQDGRPFLRDYILEIARQILSGERQPIPGARDIYRIYSELGYPEDLSNWFYITDGIDPDARSEISCRDGCKQQEAVTRRECRRMLGIVEEPAA